ncbi:haloacid dehalogenase type II [Actinopolyspora sp. H202]|uniref:haloacid dehalogenase type II n=1 Tax=Actinopolyspora sp. H202 TaxID=1500456 RepID=UPI003EE75A75
MARTPSVVVFDVNETLSDMSPIADRFTEIGAPQNLAKTWFAAVLRDGFALTAAGSPERFAVLADSALRTLLNDLRLDRDVDEAVEHVLSGFMDLPVHPDVPDGARALRAAGFRLVTLSNGSTRVAERLLTRAGIRQAFEVLLSVEDAGIWKPARGAYEYAARTCGTDPAEMLLVAVHPWDIDGAARAGMSTAWLNRSGAPYPAHFTRPEHTAPTLNELSDRLTG